MLFFLKHRCTFKVMFQVRIEAIGDLPIASIPTVINLNS